MVCFACQYVVSMCFGAGCFFESRTPKALFNQLVFVGVDILNDRYI